MQDKILWSSNAAWTTSGYGQQTALFLPRFQALGYDMAMSCFYGLEGGCLDWNGVHCYPTDQSRFGNLMLGEYAAHHGGGDRENCLVFTLQDVWVLLAGINNFQGLRFVCWTPIDHDPVPPLVHRFLSETKAQVVAMTRFGQRALENAGFGPVHYVPHGIDTNIFTPATPAQKAERRAALKIPQDAFLVGMVANNQGIPARKGFPQAFMAFKEFQAKHKDAVLYVHSDVFGRNGGMNLIELAKACEIPAESMRTSDQATLHMGLPPQLVAGIHQSMDVLLHPSLGEGFGLTLIEAQACGVPVIATDWTAMSELCGAGWTVQGERFYDQQGSFQKVPYIGEIVDALEESYNHAAGLAERARTFAVQYDVDTVMDELWVPTLDVVTAPREVPPLAVNRAQRRIAAKEKAKVAA